LSSSLDKLLANPRVWRGHDQARHRTGLASGYPELDKHLPRVGWPPDSLTEILTGQYGIGELRLLMPALARLSKQTPEQDFGEPGWIAWIAPPFQPYPPALQQCGIDLSRMLIVRPQDASEILWSAEQALSSGSCAAVLLWPEFFNDQASRRLQLAAEKGRSWAIAFRPLAARQQSSAAALRIELRAGEQGTRVRILKSRGGRPAVIDPLL
jgi:cell division inhibitor SulA/protein ImuA